MKIAFVINDFDTELAGYTTTYLALAALSRGNDVYYVSLADLAVDTEGNVAAPVRCPPRRNYRSTKKLMGDLKSDRAEIKRLKLDTLDIIFLRNNPAEDMASRPWARLAGVNFGRLCLRNGAIVLNDPDGLAHAVNKIYLHSFPQEIRPASIITRDRGQVRAFARKYREGVVIKPLTGFGGAKVFLIQERDRRNFNQILDTVLTEGYALVQEYLPEAQEGDTRLFLMNGRILEHGGQIAAVARACTGGDLRSNLTAGGTVQPARVTKAMLRIADALRARLVEEGMFLVGADIVGDKVLEINVFSPGALAEASHTTGVDFSRVVIAALERKVELKVELKAQALKTLSNIELATL
jgi:glutathione synthase